MDRARVMGVLVCVFIVLTAATLLQRTNPIVMPNRLQTFTNG